MGENTFTLAMLSFFSTTVDDFCVILIFYAREYVKTHSITDPQTIVSFIKISIGQLIGFSIIVGLSLVLGLGLHSVVNNDYIDLIGLLPIFLGIYKLYELLEEAGKLSELYKMCCVGGYTAIGSETDESPRSKNADSTTETFDSENNTADEEKDAGDVEMMSVVVIGESVDVQVVSEEESSSIDAILNVEALESLESVDNSSTCFLYARKIFFFLDPLTFEVAIYALMFGTDNIAIYVALFSNVSLLETAAVCLFFYAMLLLYLIMALFIIIQVCSMNLINLHSIPRMPQFLYKIPDILSGEFSSIINAWIYSVFRMTNIINKCVCVCVTTAIEDVKHPCVLQVNELQHTLCLPLTSVRFSFCLSFSFIMATQQQCPKVGKFIGDNANYLVPIVLITLGLFIVHDSILWRAL